MQADDRSDGTTLPETSDRSAQILEHLGMAVCESDADGRVLYANPFMEKLLGYSPEALRSMRVSDFVHPNDADAMTAHREAALRSDTPSTVSFRAVHRDGSTIFVEASMRRVCDASGTRVVTLHRNVGDQLTRSAALEKQLRLERTLADLSRRFLLTGAPGIDEAIHDGLARLAHVASAERAFLVCLPQGEHEEMSFFEWFGDGVREHAVPTRADFTRFSGFAARLRNGEAICTPNVSELSDEFAPEREALLAAGVRSHLLLPSMMGDRLVGILGMHCISTPNTWPDPELGVLRLMTDVLTGTVRQRRYETAVAVSAERFHALADNSRDPICEISASGAILYVSPAYTELLGVTPAELIGTDGFERLHEEDQATIRRGIADALAGDDRGTLMYRTKHRDGSLLYIEASARAFSSENGEARLVAVLRDVTARERNRLMLERQVESERQVAELSRFFLDVESTSIAAAIQQKLATVAAIADGEHSWMYTVDPSDKRKHRLYEHWSDSITPSATNVPSVSLADHAWRIPQMLSGGEVVVDHSDSLPEEAAAERADMVRRGVRSFLGIPLLYERRLIGFMGFETLTREHEWSRETIMLLRLIAEIFVSALRREQADLELERSRSQLVQSQKMEAVGTLAGGIAHDFNNHLSVMLGNARFVLGKVGEDADLRGALVDLQRSAEHCAQLTSSLLAFSKQSPTRVDVIEVSEILKTVAELVKPLLPRSIHFEIRDDGLAHTVRVDATHLHQVLVNLLVNARDAMPAGGHLTLRSRRCELPAAEARRLGLSREESYVEIAVRDTGEGMEPEILERIFEPFFTTKPLGKGTGLGLATAYGIVQQSRGAITVDSKPGAGTEFRVLLPRAVGSQSQVPSQSEEFAPGSETVLLVEDEPAVRRLVARILRGAGYRVIEAADGVEGLEAAVRDGARPDLLVTDLVMPRMGGADLAARLQASRPDLPVLFLSGHAEPADAVPWGEVGSARFLQKPFGESALLSGVRRLLGKT